MSTIKTTTVTAVTVLALAAIPFTAQHAEGRRLRTELEARDHSAGVIEANRETALSTLLRRGAATPPIYANPRTPAEMLDWLDNPPEPRAWLKSLLKVTAGPDTLATKLAWAQAEHMSLEELEALTKELSQFPCYEFSRIYFRDALAELGPELPPRERLERLLEDGVEGLNQFSNVMSDWAEAEPGDALAWYQEKRASGEIFGDTLESDLQKGMLNKLLNGLGKSMPGEALNLYQRTPEEELNDTSLVQITEGLATSMAESGVDTHLVSLLDDLDEAMRPEMLKIVSARCAQSGNFARGMDLFERYEADPQRRLTTIDHMFDSLRSDDLVSGGLDWVSNSMGESEASTVLRRIAGSDAISWDGVHQWAELQPPGGLRDYAHAGRVDSLTRSERFARAMTEAVNIQDPNLAASVRESVARQWLHSDESAATQALPNDLLQRIRNP